MFLQLLAYLQQKQMLNEDLCLFVADHVRTCFETIATKHVLDYAEFLDSVGCWRDNQQLVKLVQSDFWQNYHKYSSSELCQLFKVSSVV